MTVPTRLRLEHLPPGQACGAARPRGSWRLPAGTAAQQAYAVRISGPDGPVWESGRRAGGGSALVDLDVPAELTGRPATADPLTWQIRVWTDRSASGWSEPAPWTSVALFPGLDAAVWIAPHEPEPAAPGSRPAHRLQHSFTLAAAPAASVAWATAHGMYELFVNGHRVGDAELTPGFTAYRTRLQVHAHDVTRLLRAGANDLEILLSDGWYRGRHGFERHADGYGTRTAALLALDLRLPGGDTRTVTTGPDWWSRPSGIIADLMDGQHTDLRAPAPGSRRDPADPAWRPAPVTDRPAARLELPVAPPVRAVEELAPVALHRVPGGTVADFGINLNGWVRLADLGPRGTVVTLTHGELRDDAGRVTTENLRAFDFATGERLPAGQVDTVTAAGRRGETAEPRHTTHGFRYVQVDGRPDLAADDLRAVVVHSDLPRTGWFRCGDHRLEALHEAAVRSFLGNACDIPTDCPQRERSGFTGDWQVFADAAAFTHDVAGFGDKWLRDLAADQRADGRVPTIVPDPADPAGGAATLAMDGSAGWGDAAVIVPWTLWRAYGDRDLLARQYPSMVRWVGYAAGCAGSRRHPDRAAARPTPAPHEEFLWDTGFHFGEWLEPGEVPDLDPARDHGIVATAYLARSARLLSRIAGLLGRDDDRVRHDRLADAARDAWQREYLSADGELAVPTQANHVRALAFDLVPPHVRSAVADRLTGLLRANDHHLATGFLSTGLLLPVLADTGHLDEAYRVLFSPGEPSWLGMIDRGATTIWENWAGPDDPRGPGSLNHYAKGAVIGFLHRYVAGIRLPEDPGPEAAGYRRFVVAPQPGGGLTWADATHDSPNGRIRSAWRRDADGLLVDVEVPPGTRAEIRLPDGRVVDAGPGRHVHRCGSYAASVERTVSTCRVRSPR
ncbi:glycoside hydrolase family 78 protein [Pseudonocardia halophobica]|uniref:family 78 glycoside hydrolase catalytic domain n=1 Tax=Pseudonocardia halophobica TaxID=29401 RepID=UPI0031E057DC